MFYQIKVALAYRAMQKARLTYVAKPTLATLAAYSKAQRLHYAIKYPDAPFSSIWSV